MVAEDMRTVLSWHDDFRNEKAIVEHHLSVRGHIVMFIPKFHCELNPIERVWGQAEVYSRVHTNFTLPGLCQIINPALDSVSTDQIQKFFRKVQDYENAYLEGEKKLEKNWKKPLKYINLKEVFLSLQFLPEICVRCNFISNTFSEFFSFTDI